MKPLTAYLHFHAALFRERFEPQTMAFVEFYHYTSETAADDIIESGVIKESLDGGPDAHLGTGKIHWTTRCCC